jgi:hypothetical protein
MAYWVYVINFLSNMTICFTHGKVKKKDCWCRIQFINGSDHNNSYFWHNTTCFLSLSSSQENLFGIDWVNISINYNCIAFCILPWKKKQCDQYNATFFFPMLHDLMFGTWFWGFLQMVDTLLHAWTNTLRKSS